jgi:hypothetical protein
MAVPYETYKYSIYLKRWLYEILLFFLSTFQADSGK